MFTSKKYLLKNITEYSSAVIMNTGRGEGKKMVEKK